jgi:hypothetical protein
MSWGADVQNQGQTSLGKQTSNRIALSAQHSFRSSVGPSAAAWNHVEDLRDDEFLIGTYEKGYFQVG